MVTPKKIEDIQLKWKRGYVGLPVAFLRSSLFCINRKAAPWNECEEQSIQSLSGITITATGPRLDQFDRLVYCALLQLCWEHDLPNPLGYELRYHKEACFSFRLGKALKLITHSKGKASSSRAKCVWESIKRLASVSVYLFQANGKVGRDVEYRGPLCELLKAENMNMTKEIGRKSVITVRISPKLGLFFKDGRRAELQWDVLRELAHRRDNIASWLYGFYSTHSSTFHYAYNEDTLIALMGRKDAMQNPYVARKRLLRAIDVLDEVLRRNSKSFRSTVSVSKDSNIRDRRQQFSFVLNISDDLSECSKELVDADARRRAKEADMDLSGEGFGLEETKRRIREDSMFDIDDMDLSGDGFDLGGPSDKPLAF